MSEVVVDLVEEALHEEERAGVDWRAGLAGALGATGPLAVGLAVGEPVAGFIAAIGALNTALSVPADRLVPRLGWGTLAVLVGGVALVLADVADGPTWSLALCTLLWVGTTALAAAAGTMGTRIAFTAASALVIFAGLPPDSAVLPQRLLWFALGAVPALGLMALARAGARENAEANVRPLGLCPHAVRLAVAVTACTLLYRAIDLPHGYWVPLTALAVLQPGRHATQIRAVQRAAGTLGAVLLILAVTVVTDAEEVFLGGAVVAAFVLYAMQARSYVWLVVGRTTTMLLLVSAVTFSGDDLALDRVGNSAIGIVIGLGTSEAAAYAARLRGARR